MEDFKIKNGKLYNKDDGQITDLSIVVKADEGKVLSIGNYEVQSLLCKYATPINGWDMRVLRIKQTDPNEAVSIIERLRSDPELCKAYIRACESGETTDISVHAGGTP